MTKNFQILEEYEFLKNQNEIKEKIKKIETAAKTKNVDDSLFTMTRRILEDILRYETKDDFSNLNTMLKNYIDSSSTVPSKIKDSMYTIKQWGNEAAHALKINDKPFHIEKDFYSVIELLKNLQIIFKYICRQKNNDYIDEIDEIKFEASFYENKVQSQQNISIQDVAVESASVISRTKGIFELISQKEAFMVPSYQRSYSWKEENVLMLLQDLSERMKDKKEHYLGSLAIANDSENSILRLIDGQQRITTSLLLINAFINRFKQLEKKLPDELLNLDIKYKYKNKTSYGDIKEIKTILHNFSVQPTSQEKESVTWKNYLLIQEFLSKETNDENIDEYLQTFIHKFVITELSFKNDLSNEIQVFENLNSKGLELSSWDLIKNYIFKNIEINVLLQHEQEIEGTLVRLFVQKINIAFGEADNERNDKVLSTFFQHYAQIISMKDSSYKTTLSDKGKAYRLFANSWPKSKSPINSMAAFKEQLLDIARYFEIYLQVTKKFTDQHSPFFQDRITLHNTSEHGVKNAFLMHTIYENAEWEKDSHEIVSVKNKNKISQLMEEIEKYITRLFSVNNKKQSLTTFFDSLMRGDINDSIAIFHNKILENGSSLMPSITDFKDEISNGNMWPESLAKGIIHRLEFEEFGDRHWFIIKPSLEHIFPQNPPTESAWINGKKLTTNLKQEISNYVNMFGNYAIISQSLNSKVGNKGFAFKKEKYLEKDAQCVLLTGKFKQKNIVNIFEKEEWTFKDIKQRSKDLAEVIVNWYKFPWE